MSGSNPLLKQIDNGLANYYKQYSRKYVNEQGVGKFATYCDGNDFDDEAIQEELTTNIDDCMLIDFDEDFPFPEDKEPQNRNEFIFNVIKQCSENKYCYTPNAYVPLTISANDFRIDEKEIEEQKKEYTNHCPTIFDQAAINDQSFVKLFFIGQKMDQSYLQLIADLYIRDKITHSLECTQIRDTNKYKNEISKYVRPIDHINVTAAKLNPETWANMNEHTKEIKNWTVNHIEFDLLTAALKSYYARMVGEIPLCPMFEIQDNYYEICNYISEAVDFVYNLTQEKESCPFQFDLCIAFKEVILRGNDAGMDMGDDDDDDDVKEKEYIDCFGDIKARLKKGKLEYLAKEISVNDVQKRFKIQFNEFRNKIKIKQYPQRFRIVSILDRRKEINELIFCNSMKGCFEFPANKTCDNLWCFNSSKTCIIPSLDEKDENDIINVAKTMNSGMLVLSFHVESADQIRCYLYLNGRMMRFMADDLDKKGRKKSFLQQFFCQSNNDEIDADLIDNIRSKLVDREFDAFYKKNKIAMNVFESDIANKLDDSINGYKDIC